MKKQELKEELVETIKGYYGSKINPNSVVETLLLDIDQYIQSQTSELKKHLQILLASMDGDLEAKRMEYGESYPESAHSKKAKQYLKSIK